MWNPSTCECQCNMWCKTGQYLDHKNCICKNKLIGRIIEECTSVINETMINNKDNTDNYYTITYVFVALFSVLLIVGIVCFCVLAYFKWFKGKKLFKNKYIYLFYLINIFIKSLKIKNQSYYYWNDIIFIDDFNTKYFKIAKRESRIGIDIYYIGYALYKLEHDTISVKLLYLSVKSLLGSVEKVDGSSDRYLVIDESNIEVINVFNSIRKYIEDKSCFR